MIAGGGALVLLISLFLDWYKVEFDGLGGIGGVSEGGNAFDALGLGPLLLAIGALIVIAIVVARAMGQKMPDLPVPLSTVILGIGALAVLYILFRIVVDPVEIPDGAEDQLSVSRSIGIFLAFLSALAITAGGFLSARERGDAIPGVGGGGGGSPLGAGQPAGGQPAGGYTGQPAGGAPVATPTAGGAPAATPTAGGAPAAAAGGGAAAAGGSSPKADWYPDPQGQARLRYWDGSQWTDQTAD